MSGRERELVKSLVNRSRWTRIAGYLGLLARYATAERIRNIRLNEWEFRRRRTVLKSVPPQITLDVTNVCNLRCPLCATGAGRHDLKPTFIDPGLARAILQYFAQKSFHAFLYCWGEPLLHPGLAGIIRDAKELKLAVTLSTNLQVLLDRNRARELVAAGPDVLVLSIDGMTLETYARYRVGGDLSLALRNLDTLRRAREDLGRDRPVLEWQSLLFPHNLHEVGAMIEQYKELGADRISFESPNLLFGDATAENAAAWLLDPGPDPTVHDVKGNVDGPCWWPYRSVIIGPDGRISPCCYVYGPEADWGNLAQDDFLRIWNSERFVCIRRVFSEPGTMPPSPCDRCSVPRPYTGGEPGQ